MKIGICITSACIALSTSAQSQDNTCRDIGIDLDRLACYDQESGRTPEVEEIRSESAWTVRVEESEMTDDTTVFAYVFSEDPVSCRFGQETKPQFMLRCRENTTAIAIVTDCHLASGTGGYGQVTYRIDDLDAVTKGFEASTNNKALGLWNGGTAIPMIKEMLGHETMLTRFTPYGENAISPRFNITGIDEAVSPLRESCGW